MKQPQSANLPTNMRPQNMYAPQQAVVPEAWSGNSDAGFYPPEDLNVKPMYNTQNVGPAKQRRQVIQ